MKKKYLLICLVLTTVFAQAQSKKENAVKTAVEALTKAMVDGDREQLAMVASDHLSYGHSGGHVEGKTDFVEKIASGKSDFVTIDITEQTIDIVRSIAVVRHVLTAVTNDNGKPGNVKLKVLLVFQKEGSSWKLLVRQAVKA